jgi:6-phosphogluconolactonase
MITKVVPGQLVAEREPADVAKAAAARIARALRGGQQRNGNATLALSGGNTPRDAYAHLAREPGIDWSRVDVFWVDERAAAPTDDRSNYRWAKATLLDAAGIPDRHVHRMRAEEPDLAAAAAEYEREIRRRVPLDGDGMPAFDALVLGVGDDGHTASLFPGDDTVDVTDRLVVSVPAASGREARMTLTAVAIEHARNVFILAVGEKKLPALERVWAAQGNVHETPARVVRGCRGAVVWLIDRAAGGIAD